MPFRVREPPLKRKTNGWVDSCSIKGWVTMPCGTTMTLLAGTPLFTKTRCTSLVGIQISSTCCSFSTHSVGIADDNIELNDGMKKLTSKFKRLHDDEFPRWWACEISWPLISDCQINTCERIVDIFLQG